jgi:hypothetical protein
MFNFQQYFKASKPVAEHFDGHYIDYDKKSGTDFRLKKGLLPRYVVVVTLKNENTEGVTGTVLRDCQTDKVYSPPSEPGDFLIFDNIRFRHSVPTLEKPRVMVGLRTFDSCPFVFSDSVIDPHEKWKELPDSVNSGFILPVKNDEALEILRDYYTKIWPMHWLAIKEEGAVF